MSYFDASIPQDSEAVALGASRIRGVEAALNPLIAQIFTDGGAFLPDWVTNAQIQGDPLVDSNRAIGANQIKNNAVTLRTLVSDLFLATASGRAPFADQVITTAQLSADISLTTSASFTQPAINNNVAVSVASDPIAAELVTITGTTTTSASFVQPAVGSSVTIPLSIDPAVSGIVAGMTLTMPDTTGVDTYNVTSVNSSPFEAVVTLGAIGGTNTAGTSFAAGQTLTIFGGAGRTVQITQGNSQDAYTVIGGTNEPTNQLTLKLTAIGAGTSLTSSASYVQPAVSGSVTIPTTTDPVAAGITALQFFSILDGSFVDYYQVTTVSSSPTQMTATLISIGGTNTAGTTISSGTTLTFSNAAGTIFPSGTPLLSLGAVLSADAPGRARMADGFMTLSKFPTQMFTADTAGRRPFAPGFVTASMISLVNPPDGFVKGRIVIPGGLRPFMAQVSTSVDLTNQVINVTNHGITDATSLATVQAVSFAPVNSSSGSSLTTISTSQTGLSPLNTQCAYYVRVNDTNSLLVYRTPTDALNKTNQITFTGNFGSPFWMGYFLVSSLPLGTVVGITPYLMIPNSSSPGTPPKGFWGGYNFSFISNTYSSGSAYSVLGSVVQSAPEFYSDAGSTYGTGFLSFGVSSQVFIVPIQKSATNFSVALSIPANGSTNGSDLQPTSGIGMTPGGSSPYHMYPLQLLNVAVISSITPSITTNLGEIDIAIV